MDHPPVSGLSTESADLDASYDSSSQSAGSRWVLAGALVALVAVVGFVAWNMLSSASSGGADSPEAAVEALVAGFEASDLDAVLDSLVPGERDVARDALNDMLFEFGRIDLLADDIDLAAIPGFDIEVLDLLVTSTPVGDDVAWVTVSGTLRATIFGADLPLGPALADGVLPVSLGEIPSPPPTPIDLSLAAQRHDGRWYVSLGYTLAEIQRNESGWPVPDPNAGITPQGSDSPEAAVQALLAAHTPFDPAALIAQLNPGEASAAHRHAANFLPQAEASAAEWDFSIDDVEYRIDVDGDRADVHIDLLVMTTTTEIPWDGTVISSTIRYEDGCVNVKDSRSGPAANGDFDLGMQTDDYLAPGATREADGSVTMCPDDAQYGFNPLPSFLGPGLEPPLIGLVRYENAWYISPTRSVIAQTLKDLRAVPDGGGRALIEQSLNPYGAGPMDSGWSTVGPEGPTESTSIP